MYVSRGIGTSLLPLRIGSLPELIILDWHLTQANGSMNSRAEIS